MNAYLLGMIGKVIVIVSAITTLTAIAAMITGSSAGLLFLVIGAAGIFFGGYLRYKSKHTVFIPEEKR